MNSIIRKLAAASMLALGPGAASPQTDAPPRQEQSRLDANIVNKIMDTCNSRYSASSQDELKREKKRQRMGGSNNPEEIRKKLIELCVANESEQAKDQAWREQRIKTFGPAINLLKIILDAAGENVLNYGEATKINPPPFDEGKFTEAARQFVQSGAHIFLLRKEDPYDYDGHASSRPAHKLGIILEASQGNRRPPWKLSHYPVSGVEATLGLLNIMQAFKISLDDADARKDVFEKMQASIRAALAAAECQNGKNSRRLSAAWFNGACNSSGFGKVR